MGHRRAGREQARVAECAPVVRRPGDRLRCHPRGTAFENVLRQAQERGETRVKAANQLGGSHVHGLLRCGVDGSRCLVGTQGLIAAIRARTHGARKQHQASVDRHPPHLVHRIARARYASHLSSLAVLVAPSTPGCWRPYGCVSRVLRNRRRAVPACDGGSGSSHLDVDVGVHTSSAIPLKRWVLRTRPLRGQSRYYPNFLGLGPSTTPQRRRPNPKSLRDFLVHQFNRIDVLAYEIAERSSAARPADTPRLTRTARWASD